VGWKLFLACFQFLPSPEAVIVDVVVIVVIDIVDLEAMRFVAMDNIIENQTSTAGRRKKVSIGRTARRVPEGLLQVRARKLQQPGCASHFNLRKNLVSNCKYML
jgi:hypothetical protein